MVKTGSLLKISYWFFGSVLALLVLGSVAVGFVDWNQYRGTLSAMTSDRLGMRVDLGGKVSVSLLPRPEISAETVRLLPAGGSADDVVATADRIDMRLGLSALLKGEVAFQRLGFDSLEVVIEEDADGNWRVRGWPETPEEEIETASSSILMERLQIDGGTLHFIENSGQEHLIEGLSFDLQGRLPEGPLEWRGSFIATGQDIQTTGRMRPSRQEGVQSLKSDVVLPGGTLELSGRLSSGGFVGRIQSKGDDLAAFSSATHSILSNTKQAVMTPEQSFALDVQIDREGTVYRALSRQMEVGGTHGRLDLALAPREGGFHITGSVSLGIIDIDPWLAVLGQDSEPEQPDVQDDLSSQPSGSSATLSGALDVAIEGVTLGGGVIQQMDAVLRFTEQGPRLDSLQALLPGGSGLSFTGQLTLAEGQGDIKLMSGNLPELLRWANIDVSSQIPAGRLATGELTAKLNVKENTWQLADLEARVDTTNLKGTLSGTVKSPWPEQVHLGADVVNLDAYLSEGAKTQNQTALFEGLPEQPMQFMVTADKIQWRGNQYKAVSLDGSLSNQEAAIAQFMARYAGGKLSLVGAARPVEQDVELQAEVSLKKWTLPVLAELLPRGPEYIRALSLGPIDGMISISGPLADTHLSAEITDGPSRRLNVSGSASLQEESGPLGLQGTLKHEDLSGLAKLYDLTPQGALPSEVTFSVERADAGPMQVDLSGTLAGGQFLAEGQTGDNIQDWHLTYDHRNAKAVVALLGGGRMLPEPEAAFRATAKVSVGEAGWSVSDLDMRNGAARLAGHVESESAGRIGGKLAVAGLSFNPKAGESGQAQGDDIRIDNRLFDYAGQVNLSLDQIKIAGQQISAPNAMLLLGDSVARLDLGEDAQVNGSLSTMSVDLTGGEQPKLSGTTKLANVDIGAVLAAYDLPSALSGSTSMEFTFEGEGATLQGLLRGLKGRGEFKGRAGSLNFLSVPTLIREMGRAPSATSFLSSIGSLLRQGSTIYSDLDASLTLDSGTVLLERFIAGGDWGGLNLDGQISFIDSFLNLKGQLDLASPPDAPVIPVEYSGPLDNPTSNWASRALERFVIAGIERRIRTGLLKDLDKIQGDKAASNPGAEVFSRAFGFLDLLRKKQEAEKKAKEEEEQEKPNDGSSQGTEGQRP